MSREARMNREEAGEELPRGVSRIWTTAENLGGPGGMHRNKNETDRIAHAHLEDERLRAYFKSDEATGVGRGRGATDSERKARRALEKKLAAAWKTIEDAERNAARKKELARRREGFNEKRRRVDDKRHHGEKKAGRQKPRDWS